MHEEVDASSANAEYGPLAVTDGTAFTCILFDPHADAAVVENMIALAPNGCAFPRNLVLAAEAPVDQKGLADGTRVAVHHIPTPQAHRPPLLEDYRVLLLVFPEECF